jgi:hypothetical protein
MECLRRAKKTSKGFMNSVILTQDFPGVCSFYFPWILFHLANTITALFDCRAFALHSKVHPQLLCHHLQTLSVLWLGHHSPRCIPLVIRQSCRRVWLLPTYTSWMSSGNHSPYHFPCKMLHLSNSHGRSSCNVELIPVVSDSSFLSEQFWRLDFKLKCYFMFKSIQWTNDSDMAIAVSSVV